MFSKNKQGEWEVKIPSVCIFEGHFLALLGCVLCASATCCLCYTHEGEITVWGLQGMQPPCETKLFETLKSLSMHCNLSPNTTKCRGWGGSFLSL